MVKPQTNPEELAALIVESSTVLNLRRVVRSDANLVTQGKLTHRCLIVLSGRLHIEREEEDTK